MITDKMYEMDIPIIIDEDFDAYVLLLQEAIMPT